MSHVGATALPWIFTPAGYQLNETVLRRALSAISAAGFDGLPAEIPSDMSVPAYSRLLADHNLVPAPGYFMMATDGSDDAAVLDLARQHAELHLELGLDVSFLAADMSAERLQRPAQGVGHDVSRFDHVVRLTRSVAEVMKSLGVTPAIHQHVGSWIETGEELDEVLGNVPPGLLAFGPDIGHLHWAGIDPRSVVQRHRYRVAAVHLKDLHTSVAAAAAAEGLDYFTTTLSRHIWTEPDRGDARIQGVIDELSAANFDGWYIVEVDHPDFPDAEESTAYSGRWARDALRSGLNAHVTNAGLKKPGPR
jgi:inosose dehydratase